MSIFFPIDSFLRNNDKEKKVNWCEYRYIPTLSQCPELRSLDSTELKH